MNQSSGYLQQVGELGAPTIGGSQASYYAGENAPTTAYPPRPSALVEVSIGAVRLSIGCQVFYVSRTDNGSIHLFSNSGGVTVISPESWVDIVTALQGV